MHHLLVSLPSFPLLNPVHQPISKPCNLPNHRFPIDTNHSRLPSVISLKVKLTSDPTDFVEYPKNGLKFLD